MQNKNILYLSDLFKPKEFGNIEGTCVVCGRETDQGLEISYSQKFTNYNLLNAGNCICPNCYELTRNQKYRRSMWVVNRNRITFFKKDKMLQHILNPPDPPFGMYLTRTWQKQGFFKLIDKVNYSRKNFVVALDMQLIRVNLEIAKKMASIAQNLRVKKITKKELRTGRFYAHRYKDIHISEAEKVREYANQNLWRLIIYAIN